MESPPGLLPFYGRSLGGDFCVKWLQSAELSLYSESSAGPMLRYIDSAPPVLTSVRPGGLFLRYMESPPGLLPFYGRSLGGVLCVIWLQPAPSSHCTESLSRARG